jgi:major membrane immunogen (membrane-anchored lipoprotein)
MKNTVLLLLLATFTMLSSCDSGDTTAYKDMVFGMSLDDVQANGYCTGLHQILEDGMIAYQCKYNDFADCAFDDAILVFQNNKLVKVHFIYTTDDGNLQQQMSKKVFDYLTSQFGQSKETNKCYAWKDTKRTFILYPHMEFDELGKSMCINELSIFSNDYYKTRSK